MLSDLPPHQKIRFRRGDIRRLNEYPSAAEADGQPGGRPVRPRILNACAKVLAAMVLLVVCSVAAVYLLVTSDMVRERLRQEAQAQLRALTGSEVEASIGDVGLSLTTGDSMLALDIREVGVSIPGADEPATRIGNLRFGVRLLPLLRGEVKLGSAMLGDAQLLASAIPRPDGAGVGLSFMDERGLVDPQAAAREIFVLLGGFFDVLRDGGTRTIEMRDVDFVIGRGEFARILGVGEVVLSRRMRGQISITAQLDWEGRPFSLEGSATRDGDTGLITDLNIALDLPQVAEAKVTGPAGSLSPGLGAGSFSIHGRQLVNGDGELKISGEVEKLALGFGKAGVLPLDIRVVASTAPEKLEFESLVVDSGRSRWSFTGAVGPVPRAEEAEEAAYRFELVSDGSRLAPQGSPEPVLTAVSRFAGHYDVASRLISVDEIGLRTRSGEVAGSAEIQLQEGRSPGLDLTLNVSGMPVGEVKQIWPWFAARGARNWVMHNIFGGEVPSGMMALKVPPGRLGNGVPLNENEVRGRVVISGTRFDVAGNIPPVRDSFGTVEFRGSDLDIELSSGTVYMPSGRTASATHGTLAVRDAHQRPVIGKLTIDVAGGAADLMELAGYDPIDADRFIDLTPADLEGTVSGTVTADIPLHNNIPAESLGWHVALDYEDLSVAKPFDGQMVTEAEGTLVVEPTQAVIEAEARLNGMPATIRLIQPFGRSEAEPEREIVVALDDAGRDALAPGLNTILSGTSKVTLNEMGKESRGVSADLTGSTLSLPWIGWSKGAGVAASANFDMEVSEDATELANFTLTGESFAASGSMSLADGQVQRIHLPSARLNRNDAFSFDMQRKGDGYAVTVRGSSIDARSAIKRFTSEAASKESGGGGSSDPVPISLDLKADTLTGFHDEVLRDVSLTLTATGSIISKLEFSGTSSSGQPVTISEEGNADTRAIAAQSGDAGALLRFLDLYQHVEGGQLDVSLRGPVDGALSGRARVTNFWVVNEPRLASIVSSTPSGGRSLNQAVRGEIDASRVQFEVGRSLIRKGEGYLQLEDGVLRGPQVGTTFQGTLYDQAGNMSMTGTFMPAYGINRLFGEIPILGQILGNGRDRGLIGITFKLEGEFASPELSVNPLSAVAPGIFRSVFEYR